jgi:hypothetical protein
VSNVIKTFQKAAVEKRRLYLDYSCWLEEAETISNFSVSATPYTAEAPIVVASGYVDAAHKKLVVFVSGGVPKTNYEITFVAQTSLTQIKQDIIGVRVH